jgi:hypothetical protein
VKRHKRAAISERRFERSASIQQLTAFNQRYEGLLTPQTFHRFSNIARDDYLMTRCYKGLRNAFEKCDVLSNCYD